VEIYEFAMDRKNVLTERRAAEGNAARPKEFAAYMIEQQVDVIVTGRDGRGGFRQADHQRDPCCSRCDQRSGRY